MNKLVSELSFNEGFLTADDRKKRLGQYYSGEQLALLLASLSGVNKDKTVIDTMSGNGDLLSACIKLGSPINKINGIEIDPIAYNECINRINGLESIRGSAFDISSFKKLKRKKWDVVITNPPYVRYQSMSSRAEDKLVLPDAKDVRQGLLKIVNSLSHLDRTDKDLFITLIKHYSGLSDLAVPAWILNAAIVADDGILALVLPESWLTRDYASVVQYILLRWFKIEFIVHDSHACWFPDAQIKTTLLVAKRVNRRNSAFSNNNRDAFLKINLSKQSSGPNSLVENLFLDQKSPEVQFSKKMRECLTGAIDFENNLLEVEVTPMSYMISSVKEICKRYKWANLVEHNNIYDEHSNVHIPFKLNKWCLKHKSSIELISLHSIGVRIGQGLRTGANQFFYLDLISSDLNSFKLKSSKLTGERVLSVGVGESSLALRKQSELPSNYTLDSSHLIACVLNIKKSALPRDIYKKDKKTKNYYSPMNVALIEYIQNAENINFGTEAKPKKVYELSAVSPNIRKENKGELEKYWYMLPTLAKRHKPDLFIPRVNNQTPKTYLNKNSLSVIDANFSTLWLEDHANVDQYFLLAIMNSTWSRIYLEYSASIMGGGALKVEATHLRRLAIPDFPLIVIKKLSGLGLKLSESESDNCSKKILQLVDNEIINNALRSNSSKVAYSELKEQLETVITRRKNIKKGK